MGSVEFELELLVGSSVWILWALNVN